MIASSKLKSIETSYAQWISKRQRRSRKL